MAQISYGSITITDITDIEDLYFEYCLALESATDEDLANPDYFYNYTLSTDTTVNNEKSYYIRTGTEGAYKYTLVKEPTGNPNTNNYYEQNINDNNEIPWTNVAPEWNPGYQIWSRQVQNKSNIEEPTYGFPFLTTAVNQINTTSYGNSININALQTRLKGFWNNLEDLSTYPAGSYMAAGIEGINIKESNYNTYGYNSLLRHSTIQFRYNNINLTTIGQDGIILYYTPSVSYKISTDTSVKSNKVYYQKNGNLYIPIKEPTGNPKTNNYYELNITAGKRGLELSSNGLFLYNNNSANDSAIELTTTGLSIKNGSIIMGGAITGVNNNVSGSIALTNYSFNRNISGVNRSSLRFAIGNKFAVAADGTLYASGAIIEGDVKIGFLSEDSNIYTKDDIESLLNEVKGSVYTKDEANNNFRNKITDIQIIYKAFANNATIDNPDDKWITEASTGSNKWTTIRPSFNTSYPHVYYAIQTRTEVGKVSTTTPIEDNGITISDILTSDGKIDTNKIKASDINIGSLSGTLNSSVINDSGLATLANLTNQINSVTNTINDNYVSKTDTHWEKLTHRIQFETEGTPAIKIAAASSDGESYLNLTGSQINFVMNRQLSALLITPSYIETNGIRTTYIHMGSDKSQPTLGWVLRGNGHLSLKILA